MNVKRFGKRNTASTHCHLFVFVLLQLAWPRALRESHCTQSRQLLRSTLFTVSTLCLSHNACSGAVAALSYFFHCICKVKKQNTNEILRCVGEEKACMVAVGGSRGCARDAVKAFQRGTWESKQLLVSLCRPVVEFAFFSLSLCARVCACMCVGVFHCQSHLFITTTMMPRPPDAKTPVGIGFKTSPFHKKEKQYIFRQHSYLFHIVSFWLFHLVASLCDILMQICIWVFPMYVYVSLLRFEYSFSLEILRRVNSESFFRNAL